VSEAIRLEGIHKSFDGLEVLKGIDLVVQTHEVICRSARADRANRRCCAASTFWVVEAGRIGSMARRCGQGVDRNAVRRQVGIVFQAFNLFPHMTVWERVAGADRC
jgi:polar amino acid transport system ATP-binding protein